MFACTFQNVYLWVWLKEKEKEEHTHTCMHTCKIWVNSRLVIAENENSANLRERASERANDDNDDDEEVI